MDKDFLKKTAIFRGMKDSELDAALSALKSSENDFSKDEVILYAGSTTDMMGLVLEGSVRIESNDMWGNRTLLSHVGKGQVFAETYAMAKDEPMLVDAVANEKCRVLMLRIESLGMYSQDPSLWRLKLATNIPYAGGQKLSHFAEEYPGQSNGISEQRIAAERFR